MESTVKTLGYYKNLPKRELLAAVEERHNQILKEVKALRSGAKVDSVMFNRSEHEDFKDRPMHYIFEIAVSGIKEKFHDKLRKISMRNRCLLKKVKGKNMYVFCTSMYTEFKL